MKNLISIIINCYNGEKYLKRAIQSVLNQNYQNWEVIFWDNQSSDNSKKIFYSFKDDRLKCDKSLADAVTISVGQMISGIIAIFTFWLIFKTAEKIIKK